MPVLTNRFYSESVVFVSEIEFFRNFTRKLRGATVAQTLGQRII